jgi:transcriptional regulator with XRE-family HTH domain
MFSIREYLTMSDLKSWRTEKGYTLSSLAKKTGFVASYISDIERGIKRPSFNFAKKIYDVSEKQINLLETSNV